MRRIAVVSCSLLLAALIFFPRQSYAQLATALWPMFQHDAMHTGLSVVDTSGNNGSLKWKFATSNAFYYSSPAVGADGTIYISDGYLYALNPNGTQKWLFPTAIGSGDSSPAIGADGTVYVASGFTFPGSLYAINPDGTEKWVYPNPTGDAMYSSPTIGTDGTIYIGAGYVNTQIPGNLYALNPDGTQKWAFPTSGGINYSPAIGSDGTIYTVSNGAYSSTVGNVYAINPDGTPKWASTIQDYVGVNSPSIGADGTIYVLSYGNGLYALNPDGSQKWQTGFILDYSYGSTPAIGSDGTVYEGADNGNLYAINPDGTEKWFFPIPTGGAVFSSPTIGADGTIYFGSDDSNIYALNSDGTQKWAYKTGNAVRSSAAIGADGSLYFGSEDGNVYALVGPPTSISVSTSLAFGNSPVGDAVTRTITVKNTGRTDPLYLGSVTSSDTTEFAETGSTCPSGGLAPGLTCTIAIRFTPSALGPRTATLAISDNTATSPQRVALSGTGTVTMTVTPTSYGFSSVKDGSKAVKAIVVHNYQTNAVSLSEGFSGPNAGDFSVTGGTCTSTLAKTAACSLIVTYAPTATGTESATMIVTDSPDQLGPYTVTFTALATVPESLSATKLIFGNVYEDASKTLNVTVSNKATTGSITLTGTTIGGANSGDFAVTGGTCTGSLAALSSCTYAVTFTPSMETAETGTLSIGVMEDPNGGPPAVALSGTGLVPIRVVPASVAFGTIVGGHSSVNKTVTVYNYGGATLTISESVSGPNATDFVPAGGTCGATLAGGGAHCTYLLKFTPSIVGAESATLGVSASGDAASPHNVSLGGTGS